MSPSNPALTRTSGITFQVMPPATGGSTTVTPSSGDTLVDDTLLSMWYDDSNSSNSGVIFADDANDQSVAASGASSAANFANLFWKAAGSTASRSYAKRYADFINVKDWGATGDGVTDDRAAIQSLIDYCQAGSTLGDTTFARAVMYFPPGNYRINTLTTSTLGQGALVVNWGSADRVYGFGMYGDNSATTRIFYDSTAGFFENSNVILLNLDNRIDHSVFQGLHFDMSPAFGTSSLATDNARGNTLCIWNRGRQGNAGRANVFRDIKCTGGVFGLGISGEGASLGSECHFLFCKFAQTYEGLITFSANALGYTVIGGYAKDNTGGGIIAQTGAIAVVMGVEFSGNAPLVSTGISGSSGLGDYASENTNPGFVCGCTSGSGDFVVYANGCTDLLANYHYGTSTGTGLFNQVKSAPGVLDSNWSVNGTMKGNVSNVYFRGNRFDNASYLTTYSSSLIAEPVPFSSNY